MRSRSSSLRTAAVTVLLIGVLGGAFAAGRSTVRRRAVVDPLRLERGAAVGVVETPAGALAAADNYVATGISATLDPPQLRRFADTVIDPVGRDRFISASESFAQSGGPPAGARVIADVVAHRLERYGGATAAVRIWALCSSWGGGAVPAQYSALVDVWLRWTGDRWQIESVSESLPGPVPGLIGGPREGRSRELWDQTLSGMSAPYYGDS